MGGGSSRDKAAAAFLAGIPGHCEAWTSLLAIQETCWGALRRPLRDAANRRGISIAELKRQCPPDYTRAYAIGRGRAAPLMAFLKGLRISLREPQAPAARQRQARRATCFLVRQMMHAYELEMADLFHIAFAKLDGTHAIATLDSGYQAVNGLEVYTVP
jgi:predicted nucleic acid-binding protein